MKFMDPMSIECEHCHHCSLQFERPLLRLQAVCPNCSQPLAGAGLKMRAMLDDQHAFMLLIEVVVEIENATGINLSDSEIEGVKSLRDLSLALELKMAASQEQREAQSIVSAAARAVATIEDIDFDVDILTALAPDRWNRA